MMSLSAIRLGIFHKLIYCHVGNSGTKFLKFHTGAIQGKIVETRRWIILPLGWYQKIHISKPSNINVNLCSRANSSTPETRKSDLHECKPIRCYKEEVSENKIIGRPATLLVIDIGTTGLSHDDKITEIAIRDLSGGENSTFQAKVNKPSFPRFGEVIPILLQFVKSRQMDGKPVVLIAHNARRFDVHFLIREFARCSMKIPDDWLFVDTLLIARQLLNQNGSKRISNKLQVLREHYGILLEGPSYRASTMSDVNILCHVFQNLTFDRELPVPELIATYGFRASEIKVKH